MFIKKEIKMKEEFKKKFDGKRITNLNWDDNTWIMPAVYTENKFVGIFDYGKTGEYEYKIDGGEWKIWEYSNLEFAWNADYIWIRSNTGDKRGTIFYAERSSLLVYALINNWGVLHGHITMKDIERDYTPATQPENFKDYGYELKMKKI